MDDRDRIRENFSNGEFDVLLSSEVGSEGLDQQHCHRFVNYDLPWNPMRIEQRIGRLDRFGQTADEIAILNLAVEGTIDAAILHRLYHRIRIFEDALGNVRSTPRGSNENGGQGRIRSASGATNCA